MKQIKFYCVISGGGECDNEYDYEPEVRHYISKDWLSVSNQTFEQIQLNSWDRDYFSRCTYDILWETLENEIIVNNIPTESEILEAVVKSNNTRLEEGRKAKEKDAAAKAKREANQKRRDLKKLEELKTKYEVK